MSSPRSRKASQAETRQRLLSVGAQVLVDHGYRSASLERIAEAAGYSKGAVYSNFTGKEQLTLEVLDRQFANRLDDLAERLTAAADERDARVEVFIAWWRDILIIEGWGRVIIEFSAATRDNAEVQAELARRERTIIDFCTQLIEQEVERIGFVLPLSARETAEMLVVLAEGLTFARTLDPTISPELLVKSARLLFLGPPAESGQPDETSRPESADQPV